MAVGSAVIAVKESWYGETCQVITHFTVSGIEEREVCMVVGFTRDCYIQCMWVLPLNREGRCFF